MGQRRRHQADQGSRWPIDVTDAGSLGGNVEVLPDASSDIRETGQILLGSVEHLNDGCGIVGIHTYHLGRDSHLYVAHLSRSQGGRKRYRIHPRVFLQGFRQRKINAARRLT